MSGDRFSNIAKIGRTISFFHVSPLEGFKAGALNFALKHTHTEAEAIAVIDSDYQVESDWLKRLVVHFDEPEVAIVQAPQDYRDFNEMPLRHVLCRI